VNRLAGFGLVTGQSVLTRSPAPCTGLRTPAKSPRPWSCGP